MMTKRNGKKREINLPFLNNSKFRENVIRFYKKSRAGKRNVHGRRNLSKIAYSNNEKSSSLRKTTGKRSANVCRTLT